MKWQPIETAPKCDFGTQPHYVLVSHVVNKYVFVGYRPGTDPLPASQPILGHVGVRPAHGYDDATQPAGQYIGKDDVWTSPSARGEDAHDTDLLREISKARESLRRLGRLLIDVEPNHVITLEITGELAHASTCLDRIIGTAAKSSDDLMHVQV